MKADPADHAPLANRFRLAVIYGLVLVAMVFVGFIAEYAWLPRPEDKPESIQIPAPVRKSVYKPRPRRRVVETQPAQPFPVEAAKDRSEDTGGDTATYQAEPTTPELPTTTSPSSQFARQTIPFFAPSAIVGRPSATRPNITGVVRLVGTPPPEKELPLDPTCGSLHTNKPTTRHYVVGKDGGLADVLVYIDDILPGGTFPPPAQPALLDQVGCEFTPYVLAVRAGQRLLVRNSDPVLHNVHRTPAVPGNREFSAAQPPNSPDLVFVLYQPELFLRFKCDVHPWMFAYVHVLHHPFFAVTDKDGKFSLPYVPLDECRLRMVHRKAGSRRTPYLIVPEKGGVSLDLHLEVPPQVVSAPTVP